MRFSCLPAALEMDILMPFHVQVTDDDRHTSSSKVTFDLRNTDARFESTIFESDFDGPNTVQLQHSGNTRWANYFKVAFKVGHSTLSVQILIVYLFKGLHSHLPKSVLSSRTRPVRISVLIDGTIPPESSLSSSAAMTCCSSIVILQAFGARELISRREMAEVAIESGAFPFRISRRCSNMISMQLERLVGVASGG